MEYKHLKFEIKALNDAGEFEGYAAVKGNIDAYGDIIQNGAFKRTIRNKKSFPILFMHDPAKPVGLSTFMKEDEKGLFTRGQLDLSTELGKMVHSGLKMGYIDSMSIGYKVIQDDMDKRGNRLLKEIKLLEYSLITKGFAANELAMVSGFKSMPDYDSLQRRIKELEEKESPMDIEIVLDRIEDLEEEIKSLKQELADSLESTRPTQDSDDSTLEEKMVIGAADLPLASRDREWDGPKAKQRIFEWAGGVDFSPDKAKRAFFWVDGDPKNRGSYKLPFADVIDGKLMAIPRALSAVQGALDGARGGVEGISGADKGKIMQRVNAYKNRMGDDEKSIEDIILIEFKKFIKEVK